MKILSKYLVLILFFLAGCAPAPTTVYVTPTPRVVTATAQPTALPSDTATKAPTITLNLPTPTIDLAHLSTRTPQPPAACPQVNAKLRISLGPIFKDKKVAYHDARQTVLDFLNEGGDPQMAIEKLAQYGATASQMDITHDGIKEFFLPSGYFTIFSCQNGKYATLLDLAPTKSTEIAAVPIVIQDLNLNGIPELFIGQAQFSDEAMYYIFEWDGSKLANLAPVTFKENNTKVYIKQQIIYTIGQSNAQKGALLGNYDIVDTDGNGLKEIIIHAGVYKNWFESSDLEDTLVLKWDGKSYVVGEVSKEASPTQIPTLSPEEFLTDCSKINRNIRFAYDENMQWGSIQLTILEFLNRGGNPEQLKSYFPIIVEDLNNDKTPEILLIYNIVYVESSVKIYGCVNGTYEEVFTAEITGATSHDSSILGSPTDPGFEGTIIQDINKNGLPEIFIKSLGCMFSRCGELNLIEWNGEKFVPKIKETSWKGDVVFIAEMDEPAKAYLSDLDNDGIKEIIWIGEVTPDWHGDHWAFYPQRLATHVYKWDGTYYSALPVEYAAPEYRFQAVQDGDLYSKNGFYGKALKSYQLAAKSASLGWWTEDRLNYIIGPHDLGPCAEQGASCPHPTPNPNERPILSAYATFRTILTQLLTNKQDEVEKTYQDLLSAYPQESPGYPITEMSTVFWTEYQASQSMEKACAKAVTAIKDQTSILKILTGGASHSMQGIDYERNPEETCPFK